jgi:prepilin-type N-terminal cleavage/methylation domain-containing protein
MYGLKHRRGGFTIIEVMIVLAIAGLILLIVFLAVPALQRNSRNYQRKVAVNAAWSAMHEYYNLHGHYPVTDTSVCSSVPECSTFVTNLSTDSQLSGFTVKYVDNGEDHYYPYSSSGTITSSRHNWLVIFPAHRCQRDTSGHPPGDANYPVFTFGPADNDYKRFSVYMILERGYSYCIDDSN